MNESRVLELAKAQIADLIMECLQLRAMIEHERGQHKTAMSKFADEQYSIRRKLEVDVAAEIENYKTQVEVATQLAIKRGELAQELGLTLGKSETELQSYKELLGEYEEITEENGCSCAVCEGLRIGADQASQGGKS